MSPVIAFQIASRVHDPAIRPYNRAIFSLKPPCVRTVTFDACFRPFVLNLHERLLLRMISHDALIVCQTNEQVKPAILIRRARALAAETARPKNFRPILGGQ